MRVFRLTLAGSLLLLGPAAFADTAIPPGVLEKAPVLFEETPSRQWVARGIGFAISIQDKGTLFPVGNRGIVLRFDGSDPSAPFEGARRSATLSNHFGRKTYSAPTYLELRRTGVYPGIDVRYYGQGSSLEYDFVLSPGADPAPIRMRFEGADRVELTAQGELRLTAGGNVITQKAPVVYQRLASGELASVASSYFPEEGNAWSIRLGAYDSSAQLVIDPTVFFTGYLAGGGAEAPVSLGYDANNTIYIAGYTHSEDFPRVGDQYPVFKESPNRAIFLTKLNPLASGGDVIPFSSYFGGTFGDVVRGMAVDPEGIVYLTGYTDDFFFPVTPGAYRSSNGETRRGFVSVLDTRLGGADSLTYSTFFGGHENDADDPNLVGTLADEPIAIATRNGHAYIAGHARTNFLPTKNAIQTTRKGQTDIFIAEFDPSQSGDASLVNSTYLGGLHQEIPQSIAVDPNGRVYVAGHTFSSDYPTTPNSLKPFYSGAGDGFVTRLDLGAAQITYSTYVGTSSLERVAKVIVDPRNGLIALAGFTLANNFPVTANAMQPTPGGNGDAFLTVIFPEAEDFTTALVYSTYYGGNDGEVPYDLRLGPNGAYYMSGYTLSRNLPIRDALNPRSALNSYDGFVAAIDPNAAPIDALLYSSYVTGGGYQIANTIEVTPDGYIHVAGEAFGNVFEPGQAVPPSDSSTNVFFFTFRPTEGAVRQAAPAIPRTSRVQRR